MTYDPNRPVRQQLTELFREALAQPAAWTTRARAWLGRVRSRAATMGGYWGGVTMRWRRKD